MMGLCCNRSLSPSTTVFKIVLATLTLILFVPLPVALRSMGAETQAKTITAAPAERAWLHKRAEVLREWLTLKSKIPVST